MANCAEVAEMTIGSQADAAGAAAAATPRLVPEGDAGAAAAAGGVASRPAAGGAGFNPAAMLGGGDNQFFTGGLGLAALGLAMGVASRGSTAGLQMLKRHVFVTMEVTSKDISYPWVLNWLAAHGRRPQHLSVNTVVSKRNDAAAAAAAGSSGFELVPGPGKYFMKYAGQYLWVERSREQQAVGMADGKPWERVTLTGLGSDVSIFEKMLVEARSNAMQVREKQRASLRCQSNRSVLTPPPARGGGIGFAGHRRADSDLHLLGVGVAAVWPSPVTNQTAMSLPSPFAAALFCPFRARPPPHLFRLRSCSPAAPPLSLPIALQPIQSDGICLSR